MKQLIEKIIGLLTKRTDFTLHYLFCYLIASFLYNVFTGFMVPWLALVLAVVIAAIIGIGKEHIDKHVRGQFIEKGDLICDGAGILTFVLSVVIGWLL